MAVGNTDFPVMYPVAGVKLGSANAGIKQTVRDDVLLIELAENSVCAGVFTRNAFCAAPVHVARQHLNRQPRALLINSGNANAGTGEQGMQDALSSCLSVAEQLGLKPEQVLPFSTGVIGEPLPVAKIAAVLGDCQKQFSEAHWPAAAKAIMTTDTVPKGASRQIQIQGQTVTITGIAKGSGMIHPDMATMLCFIATDAKVEQALLQTILNQACNASFNRITVDGDTSTNDACILMASGHSKAPEIKPDTDAFQRFSEAVNEIAGRLAELIIRDGEGATKLIRIRVEQAANHHEALAVGKTIAHSPLVKTAFFASDPNWGRILAAVGRAGVENLNLEDVEIFLGDVCIVQDGGRALSYTEAAGQKVMQQEEITVRVVLKRGEVMEDILTCDFSYDYVRINAEYRT